MAAVCGLDKNKLGTVLWLKLPRDDPIDIKELILAKVGPDKLNSNEGLNKFLEAMDEAFKPVQRDPNLLPQGYEEEE